MVYPPVLSSLRLCKLTSKIGAQSAFVNRSLFSQSLVNRWPQDGPSQWDRSLEPAGPKCRCGEPAVLRTVKHGELHNTGREFFSCQHPRDSPKNCNYFAWADGTVAFGPEAWERWGKTHGRTDWKEAMRNHWVLRALSGEKIPEVVKKALEKADNEDT